MVSGPVDWEPAGTDFEPLQLPEAVQEAAFVVFQERVAEPPEETVVGLTVRSTVQEFWGVTFTVTESESEEVALEQERV